MHLYNNELWEQIMMLMLMSGPVVLQQVTNIFMISLCRSPKRRRSRSRSGSRKRKHRKRSRSRSRDRKRKSSRSYSSERRAREREKERQKKGLPPIRSKTLSGEWKLFFENIYIVVCLQCSYDEWWWFCPVPVPSVQHNSVGGPGGQEGHSAGPH